MKTYFVRHGESEANLLREFSNRGLKHGLTEKGRAQAAALVEKLTGLPISRVFSSPLLRAVQTAEIIAQALHVPYAVVDALREYDCGVLEGRSDAASWAEYDRVLQEWVVHRRWESRIEGGESFSDIEQRFLPFIRRLANEYGDSDPGLVLVSHGGLYRTMLPLILENIDFDFALHHPLRNGEYAKAEVSRGRLVCIGWGRGAHDLPLVPAQSPQ